MAIIKCKMCGGDLNITEGMTVAECEYCGTKQTVPNVDNEKKVTLFSRANRLRLSCEFDKASSVYESIVAEFPEEAEAYWGLVLCKYGIEYVDDPATGKKIPTCHRSSFESVMEDSDFEQACENADAVARKVYREEAKAIEEIRKGIIEVSGKEQPYDIFICYKETDENGERTIDSVLAQDIYDALTEKGYRVFFSRITLEDKLGQEYEPYIFAALNSAKIMLAFGTDYEYFNAVWVKNEWSRFLKLMAADKSKHLIPCYKGIDAYDMPKEFAKLQAQDMGKVGATQDLLRGIEKIIGRKSENKETVVVQNVGGTNTDALLKRGNMALEDGNWTKADEFYDRVLDVNPECAEAYLGKALAQWKAGSLEGYVKRQLGNTAEAKTNHRTAGENDTERISSVAEKYAVPGYLTENEITELFTGFSRKYESTLAARAEQQKTGKADFTNNKYLSRAMQFATGELKAELDKNEQTYFAQLDQRVDEARKADEKAAAYRKEEYAKFLDRQEAEAERRSKAAQNKKETDYQAECKQREENYQAACKQQKVAESLDDYEQAISSLQSLGEYKDAESRIKACEKEIERIKADQEEQQRKKNELLAREKAAKQKKAKIIGVISAAAVVVVAAVALVVTQVVKYNAAVTMMENGDNSGAVMAFVGLGTFKDAQSRSAELWESVAQRDAINANDCYTIGLKSDGTVVAAGYDSSGQCNVSDWTDIVAIYAGTSHAVGLKSNGTVVATGSNKYGQCDVSDWTDIVAISAGNSHTVGLKSDGTVVATGSDKFGRCDVSDWTGIVAISAGETHTVGLKSDGTVVAVGVNLYGRCDVADWTDIVAIAAGGYHTVGLKADGTVVAVGENDDGQCNVSDWTDIVAISAGGNYTAGLKSDGTVVAVGENDDGQCNVSDWTDIVAISAGYKHTVGLKSDGTVVAVGNNVGNQCDVTDWTDIMLPNS